jgi:hypothetical protein
MYILRNQRVSEDIRFFILESECIVQNIFALTLIRIAERIYVFLNFEQV